MILVNIELNFYSFASHVAEPPLESEVLKYTRTEVLDATMSTSTVVVLNNEPIAVFVRQFPSD
jgi:hypothetical protein